MTLMQLLTRIANDDRGSTAIEYGLIASLVVIASIGAFEAVANENTGLWGVVSSQINDAMGEG
ncbi:Flp family type IVb pilin [Pontixanthobacter gangjinensis]|uniref:Flp family type IVb pilin n=1 Tax=Pontixanthobacter gangjinensis TaxID=1028742 RepID=A0A6I4SN33_9SPHN|nr:Flp family type IVb pilin [Pontixanthobacter gangjinensis]MXO57205.1 Flp family type IVb pilin [Pontixanthobacter gangjinensis]